jgi:hypothetical protein
LKKEILDRGIFMQIRILVLLILSSLLVNGCLPARNTNDTLPLSKKRAVITNKEMPANSYFSEELVPYTGEVEHIFFHPLVIYSELAFDGDAMSKGYNDWFITVKEFKRILPSLYNKNYVLIKTSDLFEERNGSIVKKELFLPKNKKPLILSVDDMNYYAYMRENGNASKLVINEEGQVATYSFSPDGTEQTSTDNEIIPLLNSFIDDHPDFSLNGAKGILALTGYEGILGYQTHELNSPEFSQEKDNAEQIVGKLKKEGWEFASHSYGHLDARKTSKSNLELDSARWKAEVEPLIGKTNIFIFPYGSSVLPGDEKFSTLQDYGFTIFCSVGPEAYISSGSRYALMDRVHIDGIALEQQKNITARFFNSDEVIDAERYR